LDPGHHHLGRGDRGEVRHLHDTGRASQPEEIAPADVFLAAADASFVTGAVPEVSAGVRSVD